MIAGFVENGGNTEHLGRSLKDYWFGTIYFSLVGVVNLINMIERMAYRLSPHIEANNGSYVNQRTEAGYQERMKKRKALFGKTKMGP